MSPLSNAMNLIIGNSNSTRAPFPELMNSTSWHIFSGLEDIGAGFGFPNLSRSTVAGISAAIAGNMLISLALNLQKLAHRRLEREWEERNPWAEEHANGMELDGDGEEDEGDGVDGASEGSSVRTERAVRRDDVDDRDRAGNEEEERRSVDELLFRESEAWKSPPSTASLTLSPLPSHLQPGTITNADVDINSQPFPAVSVVPSPLATPPIQPQNGHRSYGAIVTEVPTENVSVASNGHDADEGGRGQARKGLRTLLRWRPTRKVKAVNGNGETHERLKTVGEEDPLLEDHEEEGENGNVMNEEGRESESRYLKSKLWWCGFLLMNIGECGNFISYAYAPASIVAPLGTFALIANCVFAPLILKERFRKRDLFGITLAIIGAITVVLSSNTSETRLSPSGLIKAISQRAFLVYSLVYVTAAVVLAGLSRGRLGRQYVFVDVGLCALFGGFTVLATKGVSTLLTMEWIKIFTEWITYPILAVLIGTGVGQIKYLNRALMRFDAKVVIPIQFVLFNLSAITGSAILYRDFEKAQFHQFVTFVYGCGATFAGVWVIAWDPNSSSSSRSASNNSRSRTAPASGAEDGDRLAEEGGAELEISMAVGRGAGADGGAGAGAGAGQTAPGSVASSYGRRQRTGSMGRRKGIMGVFDLMEGEELDVGAVGSMPVLRTRHSAISLVGISPAQRLLLVHTPPRDDDIWSYSGSSPHQDVERGVTATPSTSGQGLESRRRAVSWVGEERGGSNSPHAYGRQGGRRALRSSLPAPPAGMRNATASVGSPGQPTRTRTRSSTRERAEGSEGGSRRSSRSRS
ncbi:DUF803-domain-containing protein [Stereum hirsutum FP-91666 SS1]|uniref:DUF803-domain-containing protein n=1 Tax=Stereum hirsutum (strain FP-91666) TaxID=721885 RepID=UPI000440BB7F|nr:DUF803-domain-containing protein [Stereum hirsutum FP-91666 SS1]EIM88129.1 DUF803-domain-containing protein [Stereum hirsutum FP-91666 SS1]